MSTYLLIDLSIILVPLLLSFERRVSFYQKWPVVFQAIGIVGLFYVFWDICAVAGGHWWFKAGYVLPARFLFLPIEEILFFVVAPFSCLFLYEVLTFFSPDRPLKINFRFVQVICCVVLACGFLALPRSYTALSCFALALFLFVATKYFSAFFATKNFWIFMAIGYVPFLIFNGILTGLPIVEYSPAAIEGWRIATIPVEDFIYNFSLLGFVVIVYRFLLSKRVKR